MGGIIVLVIAFIVIMVIAGFIIAVEVEGNYNSTQDFWIATGITAFFTIILLGIVSVPQIKLTSGLMPNYSTGIREGYITKLAERGIIYVTNEGQLQVGTGEMAALQEPWEFSCPDPAIWKTLNENLGKKVRLSYKQWLLQPYSRGGSSYEITDVKVLNKAEK